MLLKGTVKLCTGIIQIQEILIYCRILSGISETKENKVSFGTLLPCCLSRQASKISKGSLQS